MAHCEFLPFSLKNEKKTAGTFSSLNKGTSMCGFGLYK